MKVKILTGVGFDGEGRIWIRGEGYTIACGDEIACPKLPLILGRDDGWGFQTGA